MENIVNKKVKILEASISAMIGKTATVLYDVGDVDIIVGLPKGKGLVGDTLIFQSMTAGGYLGKHRDYILCDNKQI